jgi:hypothetical protein
VSFSLSENWGLRSPDIYMEAEQDQAGAEALGELWAVRAFKYRGCISGSSRCRLTVDPLF